MVTITLAQGIGPTAITLSSTGPQGPIGLQGPAGPTGPTGPQGPTGGASAGGSDPQLQFNSGGVLAGASGLGWNGNALVIGRTAWIAQVAGAAGSGNEAMSLFKLTPPSGSVANAPWECHIGGSTFDGTWDSVMYLGYNASRGASPAEPTLRQCIEASYDVGARVDMEMYWEFLSANGAVGWRPIMMTINRESPYEATMTLTGRNSLNFVAATSQLDIYMRGSTGQGVQITEQNQNSIGICTGDANSGAGTKFYGTSFANSNYKGGVLVQGGTAGGGASTEAFKYSYTVITNGKLRERIGDDGKISWFYNTTADFGVGAQSNYERLALNLTSGLATFAGESLGTGAANIGIAFAPKGTGIVQATTSILAHSGTAIPAGGTAGAGLRMSSTSNFGVFFGSGAPTLAAAKGSLYLRSDGTATNNRAYVNTDGGTTWTPITTAA